MARGDDVELLDALRDVALFTRLRDESLHLVAEACTDRALSAGDLLVAQDEVGDEMFVIASGLLEVLVGDRRVRLLRRGAVVGELALLTGDRRVASVRAVRDSAVWALPRASF